MAVFERGQIVSVPLDPAMGHERRGTRPALVLTTREFDLAARKARKVERVPREVIDDALARLVALLD